MLMMVGIRTEAHSFRSHRIRVRLLVCTTEQNLRSPKEDKLEGAVGKKE